MAGSPNGEGTYTWATGSRFEGMYEGGLAKEGTFYVTDEDGRAWHFVASQDADGNWMVDHPESQECRKGGKVRSDRDRTAELSV